jgi:hypothetical protein
MQIGEAASLFIHVQFVGCMTNITSCLIMQIEEAEKLAALFTRDGELTNNLFDMQASLKYTSLA